MKSIVDYTNKLKDFFASKQALTTKVNTSDIANNLTTTASGKVLDARQGKVLNTALSTKYDTGNDTENTLTDDDYFPFYDYSVAAKKKTTWANIKSVLSNLFSKKADITTLSFSGTATTGISKGTYFYNNGELRRANQSIDSGSDITNNNSTGVLLANEVKTVYDGVNSVIQLGNIVIARGYDTFSSSGQLKTINFASAGFTSAPTVTATFSGSQAYLRTETISPIAVDTISATSADISMNRIANDYAIGFYWTAIGTKG